MTTGKPVRAPTLARSFLSGAFGDVGVTCDATVACVTAEEAQEVCSGGAVKAARAGHELAQFSNSKMQRHKGEHGNISMETLAWQQGMRAA
jgi:hypothetical protein